MEFCCLTEFGQKVVIRSGKFDEAVCICTESDYAVASIIIYHKVPPAIDIGIETDKSIIRKLDLEDKLKRLSAAVGAERLINGEAQVPYNGDARHLASAFMDFLR